MNEDRFENIEGQGGLLVTGQWLRPYGAVLLLFLVVAQEANAHTVWHDFVVAPSLSMQWTEDPQTHLLNFRRCDRQSFAVATCQPPMLSRGLPRQDLELFLRYYHERILASRGRGLSPLFGWVSGSILSTGLYLTVMDRLKTIFQEEKVLASLGEPWFHLISLGGIGALLYFAVISGQSRLRERAIARRMNQAIDVNPREVPLVHLSSAGMFEQFAQSFRQILWSFTHGAPDDLGPRGYMILQ